MHWVWATSLDGSKVLINLAAACQIVPVSQGAPTQPQAHTVIVWPAMSAVTGGISMAHATVRESVEELFKLPRFNANAAGLTLVGGHTP